MTPGTTTDARELPVGPAVVPHRKNAAEWVMWLALLPLVPIAWLIDRIERR